jgi:hypothetical protein
MSTVKLIRDTMPSILPMGGRSKGDHVSVLVNEICLRLGHYEETIGPANQARLELGNCWEFALIQRLNLDQPDRYFQPGELRLDNIYGTPDLLDSFEQADCEIKATFMSSRHGPGSEKFFKYEMQLRAYLHMLGWKRGYLHVCFVNGDYSYMGKKRGKFADTGGPVYRVWRYDFTTKELEMNWATLLKQAAKPGRQKTNGVAA